MERAHLRHTCRASRSGQQPSFGGPRPPLSQRRRSASPLRSAAGSVDPALLHGFPRAEGSMGRGLGDQQIVAGRATARSLPAIPSSVISGEHPSCVLARRQHRLLRPAPHEYDQFGSAPGSSRRLVHGLAPPASGDGTAAAPGSSRSLPSVLQYRAGKWRCRYVAAPLRRGAQRGRGAGASLAPPEAATSVCRATSSTAYSGKPRGSIVGRGTEGRSWRS